MPCTDATKTFAEKVRARDWNRVLSAGLFGEKGLADLQELLDKFGRHRQKRERFEEPAPASLPGMDVGRPSASYCAGPAKPRERSNADGYDWDRGDSMFWAGAALPLASSGYGARPLTPKSAARRTARNSRGPIPSPSGPAIWCYLRAGMPMDWPRRSSTRLFKPASRSMTHGATCAVSRV
jgi:hypothetical protein